MNLRRTRMFAFTALIQLCAILPAHAQAVSAVSKTHATALANACPGNWESPACLTAVSQSNMVLVSNYGAMLQHKNKNEAAETLKQHCAASTAHSKEQFPAYAMNSAFIECVNIISDLADQTQVMPDQSHYQLLLLPALCLSKDKRCGPMEKGLLQYKTR